MSEKCWMYPGSNGYWNFMRFNNSDARFVLQKLDFYRFWFIAPATQVFYGSCPSGFQKIENSMACEDENECVMDSNICGSPIYGKCENLIGSFVCKCRMPKKSRKLIFPFSRIGMTIKYFFNVRKVCHPKKE